MGQGNYRRSDFDETFHAAKYNALVRRRIKIHLFRLADRDISSNHSPRETQRPAYVLARP